MEALFQNVETVQQQKSKAYKKTKDIDALCPTNNSFKWILLPVSRYDTDKFLKIEIVGKMWFSNLALQHVFSKALVL